MKIGQTIKKYRENANLSQEELSYQILCSRQTISNWENDKSYPDINSLKLLSDVFHVSIDQLIKDDIKEMKELVDQKDIKDLNKLSVIYAIELILIAMTAFPLFHYQLLIIWFLLLLIACITVFKIEKIKKKYDIVTYKEIVSFYEKRDLNHDEKISEKAKRPYQQFLLTLFSGIIAFVVVLLLSLLWK